MIQDLDTAKRPTDDFPHIAPVELVIEEHSGKRGRPKKVLNQEVLDATHKLCGTTVLGGIFGVHPRTVQRRLLEQGIKAPGEPVYVEFEVHHEGGVIEIRRQYLGRARTSQVSDLTDAELDAVMTDILRSFPNYGRRMIDGHLRFLGHEVKRRRLQQSYARVHGPPVAAFGARRIGRRRYNVKGYNSLCHHDGQHGAYG